jgi:hypothetical protein
MSSKILTNRNLTSALPDPVTFLAVIAPIYASRQEEGNEKEDRRSDCLRIGVECRHRVLAETSISTSTNKNEIGLVIGATETPSIGLTQGSYSSELESRARRRI